MLFWKNLKGNVEHAEFLEPPSEFDENSDGEEPEIVDTEIESGEPFVQEIHFPKILVENGDNKVRVWN